MKMCWERWKVIGIVACNLSIWMFPGVCAAGGTDLIATDLTAGSERPGLHQPECQESLASHAAHTLAIAHDPHVAHDPHPPLVAHGPQVAQESNVGCGKPDSPEPPDSEVQEELSRELSELQNKTSQLQNYFRIEDQRQGLSGRELVLLAIEAAVPPGGIFAGVGISLAGAQFVLRSFCQTICGSTLPISLLNEEYRNFDLPPTGGLCDQQIQPAVIAMSTMVSIVGVGICFFKLSPLIDRTLKNAFYRLSRSQDSDEPNSKLVGPILDQLSRLLAKADQLKTLDIHSRRALYQQVAFCGHVLLMRNILNSEDSTEKSVLDRLPHSTDQCVICLNSYDGSHLSFGPIIERGCGHQFHKKCISKWRRVNLSCPICRDTERPSMTDLQLFWESSPS